LVTVPAEDRFNLKQGYTTAYLNVDREPRFYADLAFDGSIWYGQGFFEDNPPSNLLYVASKKGQAVREYHIGQFSATGYWPKKLVNYQNVIGRTSYKVKRYPWPVMRLADLYLLYAEAKNEADDAPGSEVYKYINLVRKRAGLKSVQYSWSHYSVNPDEYKTKEGMRKIIHRERLIELAFEAKRFWALRRWKEAIDKLNTPITGWSIDNSKAEDYYKKRIVYQQKFSVRDYLWPISEDALLANPTLKQNPGWAE
jgi:hypothetical protein